MPKKSRFTYLISITLVIVIFSGICQADFLNNNKASIFKFDEKYERFDDVPLEPVRNIAEFEPMQSVIIRYPFGISYEIIAEMSEDIEVITIVANSAQQSQVESQYVSNGVDIQNCSFLIAPSDSYWTRDYGPWFVFTGEDELSVIDFQYNRPRPNDNAIPSAFANYEGLDLYTMPLSHTGGNYMTDGHGISISTDLVLTENPSLNYDQINQTVLDYLGVSNYHAVADVNGEYIKHIDCWAKFLSPDTILIREVPMVHQQYDEIEEAVDYFEEQISCYGTSYEIIRVYTPNNEPYTNSLILNEKVFVPITGSEWDDEAIQTYEQAMPGYEIIGFTGSWLSTDAIHCRTKGIPDKEMLYVYHNPNEDVQELADSYKITAEIIAYSNEDISLDNSYLSWKTDKQWQQSNLEYDSENNYVAAIPMPVGEKNISYFIHVEDNSGRIQEYPYMGEYDPFSIDSEGQPIDLKTSFVIGRINNTNLSEQQIFFNAEKLRVISFSPLSFDLYIEQEKFITEKKFGFLIGKEKNYIVGLFDLAKL